VSSRLSAVRQSIGPPLQVIRRFADAEAVCRAAAKEFVHLAGVAIAVRGYLTVVLAGGSTPRRMYQLLAQAPFRPQIDWTKVLFFWGDERAVPPEHPDSNYHMARESFLRTLHIPDGHVHRMPAERTDHGAAARDYQDEIAVACGAAAQGQPPAFDLVLLGLGADGHTASLFPYTDVLQETGRWVVVHHVPQLAAYRMTLTPIILNRAACVIFLVAGSDKARTVASVLEGPDDPRGLPAQLIRPSSGQLLWFLDNAAASRLSLHFDTKGDT
jgi:6-phosphogluconolactonase